MENLGPEPRPTGLTPTETRLPLSSSAPAVPRAATPWHFLRSLTAGVCSLLSSIALIVGVVAGFALSIIGSEEDARRTAATLAGLHSVRTNVAEDLAAELVSVEDENGARAPASPEVVEAVERAIDEPLRDLAAEIAAATWRVKLDNGASEKIDVSRVVEPAYAAAKAIVPAASKPDAEDLVLDVEANTTPVSIISGLRMVRLSGWMYGVLLAGVSFALSPLAAPRRIRRLGVRLALCGAVLGGLTLLVRGVVGVMTVGEREVDAEAVVSGLIGPLASNALLLAAVGVGLGIAGHVWVRRGKESSQAAPD